MTTTLEHPEKLYIGGRWSDSSTSNPIKIVSPWDETDVGQVASAARADADGGVAAGRRRSTQGHGSA